MGHRVTLSTQDLNLPHHVVPHMAVLRRGWSMQGHLPRHAGLAPRAQEVAHSRIFFYEVWRTEKDPTVV